MRKYSNRGQEAIEFILITTLVFFASLFTVFVFGDKIAGFFTTDSAVAKTSISSTSTITTNSQPKYTPDYETIVVNAAPAPVPVNTTTVGSYDVTENQDGSITVDVNGQLVTLPSSAVKLQNTVFEVTGSSGEEVFIKEIAYMLEKHKADFPNGNVPLEIIYGTGDRKSVDAAFVGTAEVNSITLKVGKDLVILQNDQTCYYSSNWNPQGACCATHEQATGIYRIEGEIAPDKTFTGQVTSNAASGASGTYTTNVDDSNGLLFSGGSFTAKMDSSYGSYSPNFSWTLDFTDSTKAINITSQTADPGGAQEPVVNNN